MHLVWDWNGTLLDDLHLVVAATNASLAAFGAGPITAEDHRRDFRRPVADYYAWVLGRRLDDAEFTRINDVFHDAYLGLLPGARLAGDAPAALAAWPGTQSLLSMWIHDALVPTVSRYGLAERFLRVDGLRVDRDEVHQHKAPHLAEHLTAMGLGGPDTVLIGDSVDDADAARAVGARVVLYTGGFTDPDVLAATGFPVAASLLDAVHLATRFGPAVPVQPDRAGRWISRAGRPAPP